MIRNDGGFRFFPSPHATLAEQANCLTSPTRSWTGCTAPPECGVTRARRCLLSGQKLLTHPCSRTREIVRALGIAEDGGQVLEREHAVDHDGQGVGGSLLQVPPLQGFQVQPVAGPFEGELTAPLTSYFSSCLAW